MEDVETQSQSVPNQPCPKYLKLAKNFERQLRVGTLKVGDRLPSVRQLRDQHSISVGTAVECYLWLERQGYIRAHPKSGFYVTRTPVSCPEPEVAALANSPVAVVGTSFHNIDSDAVQLGPAVVGQRLLPLARLNRSMQYPAAPADGAAHVSARSHVLA